MTIPAYHLQRRQRDVASTGALSEGDRTMFDLAMIALSFASFAILILYTYACDRM
jgi:hypothetical protein